MKGVAKYHNEDFITGHGLSYGFGGPVSCNNGQFLSFGETIDTYTMCMGQFKGDTDSSRLLYRSFLVKEGKWGPWVEIINK